MGTPSITPSSTPAHVCRSCSWVVGALNSAWRCVRGMLAAHPELNPQPSEDIVKKFTDLWGASEEWDDKVLEKHVYLGRELGKRERQAVA